MSTVAVMKGQQLAEWAAKMPAAAARGIDESTWNALKQSVFPGAKDESVLMAVDYCRARQLDVLMKPVHIVPMYVEDKQTGKKEMRDVIMPGVGLYRIQADRSGTYAGADEPEFGPEITKKVGSVEVTFPQWCAVTMYKLINGERVPFRAKEYWLENYATKSRDDQSPNAMWKRRPYGQLSKCAEAQALRKAWPEIGQAPTAEEMEGKELDITERSGPAEKVNDFMPKTKTEKPAPKPEPPAEEPQDAVEGEFISAKGKGAPEKGKDSGQVIAPNHARMIRAKLSVSGKDEQSLCEKYGIDSIESLPFACLNEALNWAQGKA